MKRALTLFTRADCPLCDQAEQLLMAMQLDYQKADIGSTIQWLEAYRDRIPVVACGDEELGWPFSAGELAALAGVDR